jgi:hypothetical protein
MFHYLIQEIHYFYYQIDLPNVYILLSILLNTGRLRIDSDKTLRKDEILK